MNMNMKMAECLLQAQPDSVANHVKARQSLIEWSELVASLLIYILRIFVYMYVIKVNVYV